MLQQPLVLQGPTTVRLDHQQRHPIARQFRAAAAGVEAHFLEVGMPFLRVRLTQLRLVAAGLLALAVVRLMDQILLRSVKRQVVEEEVVLALTQLALEAVAAVVVVNLRVPVEAELRVKAVLAGTREQVVVLLLGLAEVVLGQPMEGLVLTLHPGQPIISRTYKVAPEAMVEQQLCEDQLSILVAAAVAEHITTVILFVLPGLEGLGAAETVVEMVSIGVYASVNGLALVLFIRLKMVAQILAVERAVVKGVSVARNSQMVGQVLLF